MQSARRRLFESENRPIHPHPPLGRPSVDVSHRRCDAVRSGVTVGSFELSAFRSVRLVGRVLGPVNKFAMGGPPFICDTLSELNFSCP